MRALLLVATWLLVDAASASANAVPADHGCMGPWAGRGRNTGFTTYWTIDLTMTASPSGGRCGTIEYTNPACGGTLEDCRLVGDDIHTREHYTHNDGSCAPPGRVIIRCEGDQMRYSWIGWEQVDTVLRRPAGYVPPTPTPTPSPTGGAGPTPPSVPPAPSPSPAPSPTGTPSPSPSVPSPSLPSPPSTTGGGGCGLGCAVASAHASTSSLATAVLALAPLVLGRRRRARNCQKAVAGPL